MKTANDYLNRALVLERMIEAERCRLATACRSTYDNRHLVYLVREFRWALDHAAWLETTI